STESTCIGNNIWIDETNLTTLCSSQKYNVEEILHPGTKKTPTIPGICIQLSNRNSFEFDKQSNLFDIFMTIVVVYRKDLCGKPQLPLFTMATELKDDKETDRR